LSVGSFFFKFLNLFCGLAGLFDGGIGYSLSRFGLLFYPLYLFSKLFSFLLGRT
jgi:hypothetical protein